MVANKIRDAMYSRDNSVSDGVTEVRLGSLLHLTEDHGRDFFRCEGLVLAVDTHGDDGLGVRVVNLEGEVLPITLESLRKPGGTAKGRDRKTCMSR